MIDIINSTNSVDIESFRYLGITLGIFDILCGTSGNILTIVAVLKNKHLRNKPFNMFVVNLSIIDLLTSLCMMPFNVTGYILMKWPFGVEACILQAFFYFCCGYTSIVCLIAITMNRLVGVIYPKRYHFYFTANKVRLCLFLSWLVAPIFLLPTLFASLLSHARDGSLITGWRKDQLLCTFVQLPEHWSIYMKILRGIFQFLPICITITSYAVVLHSVHKRNQQKLKTNSGYFKYQERMLQRFSREDKMNAESIVNKISSLSSATNMHSSSQQHTKTLNSKSSMIRKKYSVRNSDPHCPEALRRNEKHMVHLSVTLCLTFIILFFPSMVVSLIPGSQEFDPRIHMAASNITWLNSCVNPFIYALLHKGMRKEYKGILKQFYSWLRKRIA